MIGERCGFGLGQGLGDELFLFRGEIEARSGRTGREASVVVLERGECRVIFRSGLDVVVAFCAAEFSEVRFSLCRGIWINLERVHDGNGVVRSCEEGGRNGLTFETGAFHFELEKRVPSGLEVGELDGIPSLFEIGGTGEFLDSATITGSFVEDFLPVEEE